MNDKEMNRYRHVPSSNVANGSIPSNSRYLDHRNIVQHPQHHQLYQSQQLQQQQQQQQPLNYWAPSTVHSQLQIQQQQQSQPSYSSNQYFEPPNYQTTQLHNLQLAHQHHQLQQQQQQQLQQQHQFSTAHHHNPEYAQAVRLRKRITSEHLAYVYRDELAAVNVIEQQRAKLDQLIEQYLNTVPHQDKFNFVSTRHCFTKSILERSNFDLSRAIVAFSALDCYCTNLINFPWREEFKTIFAFSGFFFKNIDSILVGYDAIMKEIGYDFNSNECIFELRDANFDPEHVFQVSLDCLFAIVELRQMLRIRDCLEQKYSRQVGFDRILEVRQELICDTESVVQILSHSPRLIDLDSPDFEIKPRKPKSMPLVKKNSNNSNHIIPPPNGYLESNLDNIEYIDKSPSSLKSSTSFPQNLSKASSSRSSPKISSKSPKSMDLEARLAHELEQLDILSSNVEKSLKPKMYKSEKRIHIKSDGDLRVKLDSSRQLKPKIQKWSCNWCSFENSYKRDICSVCSKSRLAGGESSPLHSGGKECSACTLINGKDDKVCRVCRFPLDDAPTYI